MRNKLSEKQHAFTLLVSEGKEAGPAYMEIYRCRSMAVASACASRLLTNAKVEKLLGELRKKAEDDSVATVLEMEQVLTEIIRGRFSEFMTNLTPDKLKSAALQEIKITEAVTGRTTTIKLNDPAKAIDLLNKMDKLYGDEPIVNIDNRTVNIGVGELTDEQLAIIASTGDNSKRGGKGASGKTAGT